MTQTDAATTLQSRFGADAVSVTEFRGETTVRVPKSALAGDSKNRFAIAEELPLSWQAFVAALASQTPAPGARHDG